MQKFAIACLWWVVALPGCLALAEAQAESAHAIGHIEALYDQLNRVAHSDAERTPAEHAADVEREYLRLFPSPYAGTQLKKRPDTELDFLLRAADTASFYTFRRSYLQDMQATLAELERRGSANDRQRSDLYKAAIGQRDFGLARRLLHQHPALAVDPVPEISPVRAGGHGALVYRVGDSPNSLQEVRLDIANGMHLVVIAHPLCGFSRRAMLELEVDPQLAPVLALHAIWLAPADRRLYLQELEQWNRQHPATQIMLTRYRADWPQFDDWATPHFYLLRDGRVLGKVSGWPQQGNRQALLQLLAQAGWVSRSRPAP